MLRNNVNNKSSSVISEISEKCAVLWSNSAYFPRSSLAYIDGVLCVPSCDSSRINSNFDNYSTSISLWILLCRTDKQLWTFPPNLQHMFDSFSGDIFTRERSNAFEQSTDVSRLSLKKECHRTLMSAPCAYDIIHRWTWKIEVSFHPIRSTMVFSMVDKQSPSGKRERMTAGKRIALMGKGSSRDWDEMTSIEKYPTYHHWFLFARTNGMTMLMTSSRASTCQLILAGTKTLARILVLTFSMLFSLTKNF